MVATVTVRELSIASIAPAAPRHPSNAKASEPHAKRHQPLPVSHTGGEIGREVARVVHTIPTSSRTANASLGYLSVAATASSAAAATRSMAERIMMRQRTETMETTLPTLVVQQPKLWSPEAPHLYLVTIRLAPADSQASAEEVETFSLSVGFRRVTVSQGQITLNERPLLIKGVNRHEHDPYTGHVRTPAESPPNLWCT